LLLFATLCVGNNCEGLDNCIECGNGKEGNTVKCVLSNNGKTLTISGSGNMENYIYDKNCRWGNYLKNIIVESSVTSIGDFAFCNCESVESVSFEKNSKINYIGESAFYDNKHLKTITLENISYLTELSDDLFQFCEQLTSISIPTAIRIIGEGVFQGTGLASVFIPEYVESIGSTALENVLNLQEINVDKDNANYSSDDGVLYDKNKTILYRYPQRKECSIFSVPDSVTVLGKYSFKSTSIMETIELPESLVSIEEEAFSFTVINYLNIPAAVNSTGSNAFGDTWLECLSYSGKEEPLFLGIPPLKPTSRLSKVHVPEDYEGDTFLSVPVEKDGKKCSGSNPVLEPALAFSIFMSVLCVIVVVVGLIICGVIAIFVVRMKKKQKKNDYQKIEDQA